ncbi:MAG: hypothetical protein QOJ07_1359 [Thermoleophilaceae bacterium]|jgi:hypothetical protein|nr:hypothetical protein [Thermoleophilaceae bacterium]
MYSNGHELACDFADGVEALEYWRARRERLAWYQRGMRREADAMVLAWERRLRRALVRDPHVPMALRVDAGLLVVRTRISIAGRRWRRRASVAALTVAAAAGAAFAAVASLF